MQVYGHMLEIYKKKTEVRVTKNMETVHVVSVAPHVYTNTMDVDACTKKSCMFYQSQTG